MDIEEALYTTRAMRRVRPDPVPSEVQEKILDAAIRAPTGGNAQNWRFLLVDDAEVISRIGPLYRDSIDQLWKTIYADRLAAAAEHPEAAESIEMVKVQRSAQWLADHFEEVPLYLFGFVLADPTGGSIFPAVWSAQLAARAHGVGSSLTVVLGVFHPDEVFDILGVPARRVLGDVVLRELRVPDRAMGGGAPPAGARGLLPQPVGIARGLRSRQPAVAVGIARPSRRGGVVPHREAPPGQVADNPW